MLDEGGYDDTPYWRKASFQDICFDALENSTRMNEWTEGVDHLFSFGESRKTFLKYCLRTVFEGLETLINLVAMLDAIAIEVAKSFQYILQ